MAKEEKKPTYEEIAKQAKKNLKDSEAYFYAGLADTPDFGREGSRNGLEVALAQLNGGDAIKELRAQGMQSILRGKGIRGKIDLEEKIGRGAQSFLQSLEVLKPKDINDYVSKRLGFGISMTYDKTYAELRESENEDEKAYASYLFEQVSNATMAKFIPESYQIRGKQLNAEWEEKHPVEKKENK